MSSGNPPLAILSNGDSGQLVNVICAHLCPLSPLDCPIELLAFGVRETGSPLRRVHVARLFELVHPEPGRPFPNWHARYGELGAPRLYISRTCENLVAQMQSAPVAKDGHDAGEAVDPNWQGAQGHAHAALRYGAHSRPAPSPEPPPPLSDEEWVHEQRRLLHASATVRWKTAPTAGTALTGARHWLTGIG